MTTLEITGTVKITKHGEKQYSLNFDLEMAKTAYEACKQDRQEIPWLITIVDKSGSMEGERLVKVKDNLRAGIKKYTKLAGKNAQISIIPFCDNVVDPGTYQDYNSATNALEKLKVFGGTSFLAPLGYLTDKIKTSQKF